MGKEDLYRMFGRGSFWEGDSRFFKREGGFIGIFLKGSFNFLRERFWEGNICIEISRAFYRRG